MATVKAADFDAFKKRCAARGAPFVTDDHPMFRRGASIHFLGRDEPEPEPKEEKKKE